MRLRVHVLPGGEEEAIDVGEATDGLHLLDILRLSPDAHIIVRDERPIPLDAPLQDGDKLSIVAVISGG